VRVLSRYARIAALAVAFFLGLGAIIAIGNAVSLALEGRQKELATLRALGFRNPCLAMALFIEVLLVAFSTSIIVMALVRWLASGMRFATSTGDHSFGFQLAITPQVFAWVVGYTALLGIVSAILPSVHMLRAPLFRALARD
ncbi:MAG: ABC transporter permease, partial [Rhodanobacteraceae bacterium]